MNQNIAVHRQIHVMLKLNVGMEDILNDNKEHKLPREVHVQFKNNAFAMCQLQSQVAQHFNADGYQLFDVTQKTHFVLHIALLSEHQNPRLCWCFTGEDFMQKSQKIAKAAAKGNTLVSGIHKMLKLYRLGLHLLMTEDEEGN
jgi:hypothetical protein